MSSIVSVYAWLYSIGLVPLFTFIAGACFTLWTQERLEKKRRKREFDKRMTERVYGPLHQGLNSIQRDLRAFQSPIGSFDLVATLEGIMEDYRYSLVEEKLRHRLEEFQKRLQLYAALVYEARRETEVYIARGLKEHEIDDKVAFEIHAGEQILSFPLIEPIFKDKTPFDFLKEEAKPYGKFSIYVYVKNKSEGALSSEHRLNRISKDILKELSENSIIQEQRRERERLLTECKSLIESIRKEIVLS